MKLCRFLLKDDLSKVSPPVRIGLVTDNSRVLDLTLFVEGSLHTVLEHADPRAFLAGLAKAHEADRSIPLPEVRLLAPVERQEVWAAGVTYLRSKKARMEESDFSASAYDKVYEADRPELFFKSMPEKVVGPDDAVGIRRDARWNVPEPELALVLNSRGALVGCTIGNDMSSRDIEGENLLYLPQAKIYDRSCALGPWIAIGSGEEAARQWTIRVQIHRAGAEVFSGSTSVSQIKRRFAELTGYLLRSQRFPNGAVLLTGTGVVPPDTFTLQPEDRVTIEITGIGTLSNPVQLV